jgi:hypothetical protein
MNLTHSSRSSSTWRCSTTNKSIYDPQGDLQRTLAHISLDLSQFGARPSIRSPGGSAPSRPDQGVRRRRGRLPHGAAPALAQLGSGRSVTLQAQRADVFEIALAASFHHRNDMVGVPQAFSRSGPETPIEQGFQARAAAQSFELALGIQAIDAAGGANPSVAYQYFFTKIARISTQTPFLHAPSRAKRDTALGNLQVAPAAEMAAVGPFGKVLAVGPAAGHAALRAHGAYSIYRRSEVPNGTSFGWAASNTVRKLAPTLRIRIYSASAQTPDLGSCGVARGRVCAGQSPMNLGLLGGG